MWVFCPAAVLLPHAWKEACDLGVPFLQMRERGGSANDKRDCPFSRQRPSFLAVDDAPRAPPTPPYPQSRYSNHILPPLCQGTPFVGDKTLLILPLDSADTPQFGLNTWTPIQHVRAQRNGIFTRAQSQRAQGSEKGTLECILPVSVFSPIKGQALFYGV